MSGLLTAIMLTRRGWDVDVFERAEEELAGRGAGIVAQPELIAQLEALGIHYDDVVAVLENQGVDKFEASWNELLETIRTQMAAAKR